MNESKTLNFQLVVLVNPIKFLPDTNLRCFEQR